MKLIQNWKILRLLIIILLINLIILINYYQILLINIIQQNFKRQIKKKLNIFRIFQKFY
jgi:hypothetical protein